MYQDVFASKKTLRINYFSGLKCSRYFGKFAVAGSKLNFNCLYSVKSLKQHTQFSVFTIQTLFA